MKKLIRSVFGSRQRKKALNTSRKGYKNYLKGFTLIELLVAMLITSIIVSVMLAFLVGVLESDRKEQAKSDAQEEVQSALSYIADDKQEAVYIYGATALSEINPADPTKSQLPHAQSNAPASCNTTNCTPVLVFWKRYTYDPTAKTSDGKYYGCLPYQDGTPLATACNASASDANKRAAFGADSFTFSLVAYYLKSDIGENSATWSNTARILRWELKDGYRWYCADNVSGCPPDNTKLAADGTAYPTGASPSYPTSIADATIVDRNAYFIPPDQGFSRPDFLAAGSLSQNAGKWRKFANFNFSQNPFTTLLDFVDDTKYTDPNMKTAVVSNNSATDPFGNPDCADPTKGVGVASATMLAQRVPSDFSNATANPSQLTSFYTCVAPEQVTARVYLRGNALARIQSIASLRKPNDGNSSFFPNVNVRVFGRSSLGLNKQKS